MVQETWLAVIQGLERFEGRSSLKTWIFRILVNRAQSRGAREQRTTPFSSLAPSDEDGGPTVDPDRFLPAGHAAAGYWSVTPSRFFELPEDRLLAAETSALVAAAIEQLPRPPAAGDQAAGRRGLGRRRGLYSASSSRPANQRVLLHRARSAVRARLEEYFTEVVSV